MPLSKKVVRTIMSEWRLTEMQSVQSPYHRLSLIISKFHSLHIRREINYGLAYSPEKFNKPKLYKQIGLSEMSRKVPPQEYKRLFQRIHRKCCWQVNVIADPRILFAVAAADLYLNLQPFDGVIDLAAVSSSSLSSIPAFTKELMTQHTLNRISNERKALQKARRGSIKKRNSRQYVFGLLAGLNLWHRVPSNIRFQWRSGAGMVLDRRTRTFIESLDTPEIIFNSTLTSHSSQQDSSPVHQGESSLATVGDLTEKTPAQLILTNIPRASFQRLQRAIRDVMIVDAQRIERNVGPSCYCFGFKRSLLAKKIRRQRLMTLFKRGLTDKTSPSYQRLLRNKTPFSVLSLAVRYELDRTKQLSELKNPKTEGESRLEKKVLEQLLLRHVQQALPRPWRSLASDIVSSFTLEDRNVLLDTCKHGLPHRWQPQLMRSRVRIQRSLGFNSPRALMKKTLGISPKLYFTALHWEAAGKPISNQKIKRIQQGFGCLPDDEKSRWESQALRGISRQGFENFAQLYWNSLNPSHSKNIRQLELLLAYCRLPKLTRIALNRVRIKAPKKRSGWTFFSAVVYPRLRLSQLTPQAHILDGEIQNIRATSPTRRIPNRSIYRIRDAWLSYPVHLKLLYSTRPTSTSISTRISPKTIHRAAKQMISSRIGLNQGKKLRKLHAKSNDKSLETPMNKSPSISIESSPVSTDDSSTTPDVLLTELPRRMVRALAQEQRALQSIHRGYREGALQNPYSSDEPLSIEQFVKLHDTVASHLPQQERLLILKELYHHWISWLPAPKRTT